MNAVVTGGTKGIGKAIIFMLASKGINISTCSRNSADLANLKEDLFENFPKVKVHVQEVDMSKKEEVLQYASSVNQEFSEVDVLVNNAGVFIQGNIYEEEEDGVLEMMINTNLMSAYHLTRAFLPAMISRKGGHIFNMCSVASLKAYPGGSSYAISKFALLGFSKCLREELKEQQIKVTSIIPGATWSDSWSGSDFPPERLMQAEDIALCVWNALQLSPAAVMEEIILRPQLGDL